MNRLVLDGGASMGFNSFKYWNPIQFNNKKELDNKDIFLEIEKQCLKNKDEFLSTIDEFLKE